MDKSLLQPDMHFLYQYYRVRHCMWYFHDECAQKGKQILHWRWLLSQAFPSLHQSPWNNIRRQCPIQKHIQSKCQSVTIASGSKMNLD